MPKIKNLKIDNDMEKKLNYIGLDLNDIPENLEETNDIKFKVLKGYDEKQYKQYKFVNVQDIDILLSDSNTFSELKENEAIKKVRDTIENFVKITVNKDEESLNAVVNSENLDVDGTVQDNNLIENIEAIGGAEDKIEEEASVLEEPKTQEEQDIEYVKQNANIIWPLKGIITSRFGTREATEIVTPNHHGIDIAGNTGADIIADMDGIVTQNSSDGDYGKHLRIEGNGVLTLYAHCSKLFVNEGEAVKQGQKIAEVGSTGRATGPHLHFEIRRDNRYINPESILENL